MLRAGLWLVCATAIGFGQAGPVVTKVEPPNWWTGHSINPVRLLVRGSGLAGARVSSQTAGLTTANVRVNATGDYLFVDVAIASSAKAGRAPPRITTKAGAAEAPFEITAPLPRAGRFQGFHSGDIIYLLMPDRFANGDPSNDDPAASRGMLDRKKGRYYHGGDLRGVINRLPYLQSLGITAIWMTPVYDNVNHLNQKEVYDGQAITDYHGYGAVDFYGVEEHLGTMQELRDLTDRAHAMGIKIIQDQVANHTGPYHPWVTSSPTPAWFNGTAAAHLANTWQTWTVMDPHASPETRRGTLDGWFLDILPDLNQNDPEVRRYLIQNSLWWAGMTGLDGIRQDTWPYAPRDYWRDWTAALRREYPAMTVVGEFFDGDPAIVAFSQGGRKGWDGIDTGAQSMFDFPLYYPVRKAFAEGQPVRQVAEMLAHDALYPNPSNLVTFLGLHDVQRFQNEPGATVEGMKLAFTFLFTARGIPLVYYGDEIAMRGGPDPDNRRDFPGGWVSEDARNLFEPGSRSAEEASLWTHVQSLARLRRELPALRRGRTFHLVTDEQQYAFARVDGSSVALVVINNAKVPATVKVPVRSLLLPPPRKWRDRLGSGFSPVSVVEDGFLELLLPARSARVLTPAP